MVRNSLAGQPTGSCEILAAMMARIKSLQLYFKIGTNQECVDEAFTIFIELFDSRRVEELFKNVYELTIQCPNCKQIASSNRDNSYKINFFTTVKFDTMDLFRDYLRVHTSECDKFTCSCGYTLNKFRRVEKLKRLNECLIITFNKFQSKDRKWFPQFLTFESNTPGRPLIYALVGHIEHSGTAVGGHYYTHSKRNDQWVSLNDSSVTMGSPEPTPNTFMVAYHMV
jgi:ubiquitin C-terminal hydrolase